MKKKRIIISLILIVFSIASIIAIKDNYKFDKKRHSNIEEENIINYETSSYISEDMKNNAIDGGALLELAIDYTPEYMLELSDAVVIASIISIDGANTKLDQAVGSTYGMLVVNNVLSGNVNQGDKLPFFKSGGIMTLEEWEKYQPENEREKREELRKDAGVDASKVYLNMHYEYDPNVVEGKVYLCYLKYSNNLQKYEVLGIGEGFRELNIEKSPSVNAKTYSVSSYKILNNITGKYESLNDYIEKNINTVKK